MKPIQRFGAVVSLTILAACGDKLTNSNDSTDRLIDADVANVSADATAEDVELMGGPTGTFGFGLTASPAGVALVWGCEERQRDGLTVVRTCVFKDAQGQVQAHYDPATTASVEIDVHVTGTVSRNRWEATVDRTRHLVVSGLTGTETTRTWNGTGSGTVSRSRHSDGGGTRTYDITYTTTITNVVVPVPRRDNGWPLSGTITRHVVIHIIGGPRDGQTIERDVTITFDGSATAEMTINGEAYTLDLDARRATRRAG
jgi:hypothetical protein